MFVKICKLCCNLCAYCVEKKFSPKSGSWRKMSNMSNAEKSSLPSSTIWNPKTYSAGWMYAWSLKTSTSAIQERIMRRKNRIISALLHLMMMMLVMMMMMMTTIPWLSYKHRSVPWRPHWWWFFVQWWQHWPVAPPQPPLLLLHSIVVHPSCSCFCSTCSFFSPSSSLNVVDPTFTFRRWASVLLLLPHAGLALSFLPALSVDFDPFFVTFCRDNSASLLKIARICLSFLSLKLSSLLQS